MLRHYPSRSSLGAFLFACLSLLILAACGDAPSSTTDIDLEPNAIVRDILVSSSAERSNPLPLDGSWQAGTMYAFASDTGDLRGVNFFLDDATSATQQERYAPYDLAGGTAEAANSFDTRGLSDGVHTLRAELLSSGGTRNVTSTFLVDSSNSWRDQLLVSAAPARTQAKKLKGATLSDKAYIFLVPGQAVRSIAFYLDGDLKQTERYAFYDAAGTEVDGSSRALDTTSLPDGQHTMRAILSTSSGQKEVSATFTVANTVTNGYVDDTFQNDSDVESRQRLSGRFDYEAYRSTGAINSGAYTRFRLDTGPPSGRHVLDATESDFLVDNNDEFDEPDAKNSNSGDDDKGRDNCENGSYDTNIYPFDVRNSGVTVLGGIFHGYFPRESPHVGVPQDSDWEFSYCNSATILFKKANDGHVDGTRMTSSWDSVRPGANFVVENSWFSRVRDDVLENDKNMSGVFQDNLVEGAFQGISSKGGDVDGSSQTVEILGNVIRLRSYPYKAASRKTDQYFGSFLKYDDKAPRTIVKDTVLAVEPDAVRAGGSVDTFYSQWDAAWRKVSYCDNNILLWTPQGGSYSAELAQVTKGMPSCFKVVTGDEARRLWNQARQNWIDCHPKVGRVEGDSSSDFTRCRANEWGGYAYSD